jgi:hypothetical protein
MSSSQVDLFSRATGGDVGRLPLPIAKILAQTLGELALRHLLANSATASARRFTLAAKLLCAAMDSWDGTHKTASQLARAAEFYKSAFGELEGATRLVKRTAFSSAGARRSQRAAFSSREKPKHAPIAEA